MFTSKEHKSTIENTEMLYNGRNKAIKLIDDFDDGIKLLKK